MTEPNEKIIGYLTREDLTKRKGPVTLYDEQGDDDDVPVVAPWGTAQDGTKEGSSLRENDAIWARFYRDGKNLGEICEEFKCGVYDLSPWLTAPLVRSCLEADEAERDYQRGAEAEFRSHVSRLKQSREWE